MEKIIDITDLNARSESIRDSVCVYGGFNVLHPGHLQYLEEAKSKGGPVVALVKSDKFIANRNMYPVEKRISALAHITLVDHVIVVDSEMDMVSVLQHGVRLLFLGREFQESRAGEVEFVVGKAAKLDVDVVFHVASLISVSQDHGHADSFPSIDSTAFRQMARSYGLDLNRMHDLVDEFSQRRALVIGDFILDHYVHCSLVGASAEAPVLVINESKTETFIGGAAVVSAHLAGMGLDSSLISVVGDDDTGATLPKLLNESSIYSSLVIDASRPTTMKTRYLVDNQKLLRVSKLKDHEMLKQEENDLLERISNQAESTDVIFICDFGYGVVTQKVIDLVNEIKRHKRVYVVADAQCSSQYTNILKFKGFDLITPTEKEARLGLDNRHDSLELLGRSLMKETRSSSVVLTLGSRGILAFGNHHNSLPDNLPMKAFNNSPRDTTGAGDAFLSVVGSALACGGSLVEACALGSLGSALAVSVVGNKPVLQSQLKMLIDQI